MDAETAATASARRDLSGWLYRRFLEVTTWYATRQERSNPDVTPARVIAIVSDLVGEYALESGRTRLTTFSRCDGQFESYALVELPANEVPSDVVQKVIEELSGKAAYRSASTVRETEERLRSELMKLIETKPKTAGRSGWHLRSRGTARSFIGIRRGASKGDVVALYGDPISVSHGLAHAYILNYGGFSVWLGKDEEKVSSVLLRSQGYAAVRQKGTEDTLSGFVTKSREEIVGYFGEPDYESDAANDVVLISYWSIGHGGIQFWFVGNPEECSHMTVRFN